MHQLRNRRECYGELIQIDGSDHDWFEGRSAKCTLLVFADDATNALMKARFVVSESTFSYMQAMETYLERHGRPVALYSDKHSVFRIAKPTRGSNRLAQFARAMAELNIDIICADTSQAKGLVERKNRTLQDRLIKWMRVEGINDMDAGNRRMREFVDAHNARFARVPKSAKDLHRELKVAPARLAQVLCGRDDAYVGQDLSCKYYRVRYVLDKSPENTELIGKRIDVHCFADGRNELGWKGRNLPYCVYDTRARVSSAAIVENKRLGSVLVYIKEQQDREAAAAAAGDNGDGTRSVKGNSGVRNGNYVPTGRRPGGRARTRDGVLLPTTTAGQGTKERSEELKVGRRRTV